MAGQLIFQPPTFHWPSEDQQMAFEEWQSHVTLVLEASNIPRERWYASIIGFLGTKGFKRWQHLDISKDVKRRKTLEDIFTTFTNTLEVSMSQWNYIDEMYSDIRRESKKPLTSSINASRSWLKNVAIHRLKRRKDIDWSYSFMRWNTSKLKSG